MKSKMNIPHMHEELIDYIRHLADIEYQIEKWIPGYGQKQNVMLLNYIFNFLFNDTHLFDDADDCIGEFLRNQDEADHLRKLTNLMDHAIEAHGRKLAPWDLIRTPEWPPVIEAAKAALATLTAPDEDTTAAQ